MKKHFLSSFVFCFVFCAVFFVGCDKTFKINLDLPEQPNFSIQVSQNGNVFSDNTALVVEKGANIRIEILSRQSAEDLFGLKVNVNGQERQIFLNSRFQEDGVFGYILLANVSDDITVQFMY